MTSNNEEQANAKAAAATQQPNAAKGAGVAPRRAVLRPRSPSRERSQPGQGARQSQKSAKRAKAGAGAREGSKALISSPY